MPHRAPGETGVRGKHQFSLGGRKEVGECIDGLLLLGFLQAWRCKAKQGKQFRIG